MAKELKALSSIEKMKKRIFEIIQIGNRSDEPSLIFDVFIVVTIFVNIFITFFETFTQAEKYTVLLGRIEFVTIIIFTAEYILRIWTAEYIYADKGYLKSKLKFIFSFYGIIDMLTILPYYLPFFFPSGAVAFRMFRVVRILHLFRINAQYDAFNVITGVLKDKKNQIVSSVFLVFVLMMASSLCMYSLEHDAQPENFKNAFSGIWWSVSTLLTVGYGDIYPITVGGRIMAIVIAFLGVGMVAIPTGIISAGFVEYYTRIKNGSASNREVDVIMLDISKGHSFDGKRVGEIKLPKGLYIAVLIRGKQVIMPDKDTFILQDDNLLLGTTSVNNKSYSVEEVLLEHGHKWIGEQVQELDISRQESVVMIKREGKNFQPQNDTCLKKDDMVLVFKRRA